MEGLPLLEGLFKRHGDFTSGFREGVFLGNILIELLCAVLISLKDSSLDSLSEEKLLEWRGVVQDLLEAKFSLSFLLEYLHSLAYALFQRQASKSIDAKIAAAEEAEGPLFLSCPCCFLRWFFVGWPYFLAFSLPFSFSWFGCV